MAEMRLKFDDELHERFKIVCAKEHVSMVSVVRELVENWIDEQEIALAQLKGKGFIDD